MTRTTYALGLGSNRWSRYGPPARALDAAVAVLEAEDVEALARSPTIPTPAMGGAGRSFANAALLIETELSPPELMRTLQAIERSFGRRPGRRWGPRVLDLDILLWSGGRHVPAPHLPHRGLPKRDFVLQPLSRLVPGWRMPDSRLSVRHLAARLAKALPVDAPAPSA